MNGRRVGLEIGLRLRRRVQCGLHVRLQIGFALPPDDQPDAGGEQQAVEPDHCPRCAGGDGDRIGADDHQARDDARAHVDGQHRQPTDVPLEQQADNRDDRHVDDEMREGGMEEHRGQQPPPFAVGRPRADAGAPRDQRRVGIAGGVRALDDEHDDVHDDQRGHDEDHRRAHAQPIAEGIQLWRTMPQHANHFLGDEQRALGHSHAILSGRHPEAEEQRDSQK